MQLARQDVRQPKGDEHDVLDDLFDDDSMESSLSDMHRVNSDDIKDDLAFERSLSDLQKKMAKKNSNKKDVKGERKEQKQGTTEKSLAKILEKLFAEGDKNFSEQSLHPKTKLDKMKQKSLTVKHVPINFDNPQDDHGIMPSSDEAHFGNEGGLFDKHIEDSPVEGGKGKRREGGFNDRHDSEFSFMPSFNSDNVKSMDRRMGDWFSSALDKVKGWFQF